MREKGCRREELLSFLAGKRGEDLEYGRILSSMCTRPHPVALEAEALFAGTNLGDPGLFPGTAAVERLLVRRLGDLLHHPGAFGYATSGGTESNIQVLRMARGLAKVKNPNVVVPESAHFSFEKACDILSIGIRTVPLDDNLRMDPEQAEEQIDRNTACLVGIAGTTEYGMVDPIRTLSEIAEDRGIFLHVDAAFGGLVIPFLEDPMPFDFSLPGVSSISVDPHKMGMSPIPAGALLVREEEMLAPLAVATPYLTVKNVYTLTGTRPGGPVAGAFAVLEYLGREGMRATVRGCMANTERLIAGLETLGIARAVTPDVNVATFACERTPPGWQVSRTRRGHLRIVCMPHVSRDQVEAFIVAMGELYA
ncbi:MAG TPA: tyrosine decarboxylase MfnA [Methanomicrobiales archaeon]|jgi:tyrosine decarboxylase/aspartate 1-decarboxylase|nr:tyrosine decarboxylase MfnA [Methanomicrobiales archaeon]